MKKILIFFTAIFILVLAFLFVDIKKTSNIVLEKTTDIFQKEELSVSILNFGDVMFDRGVRNIIENRGRDPFEYIKQEIELLKNFDIVMVNLEGPIVTMNRDLCQQKAYNFQFATSTIPYLKSIGVNMVNIANNHIYDCYKEGIYSTKKNLLESGMDYAGDPLGQNFVVKSINNKNVVFIGVDQTMQVVPEVFYEQVRELKSVNDFVIVNIHWGNEYELVESETQRVIARRLIDNGADVVFGHHPHVIQPFEVYKTGVVFYSLGNFVFDQNFGNTTVGLGASVEFMDDKKVFTILPFNIKLFAPDFMNDSERDTFCKKYLEKIENKNCSFEIQY